MSLSGRQDGKDWRIPDKDVGKFIELMAQGTSGSFHANMDDDEEKVDEKKGNAKAKKVFAGTREIGLDSDSVVWDDNLQVRFACVSMCGVSV